MTVGVGVSPRAAETRNNTDNKTAETMVERKKTRKLAVNMGRISRGCEPLIVNAQALSVNLPSAVCSSAFRRQAAMPGKAKMLKVKRGHYRPRCQVK